jgi:hypothetical protein
VAGFCFGGFLMEMNERSLSRLATLAASSLCLALALSGCGSGHSYSSSAGGTTNFTSVVWIGDSLTAGYQNGSLLDSQQVHGYAALVAAQANFRITLPLIAPPGAPSVLELKSVSPLDIVSAPGTTSGRDDITITPSDVAVPGAFVYDVLNTYATPTPMTGQQEINTLVLGFPGLLTGTPYSQYSLMLTENPTTIFAWIGNNDALIADITSTPLSMTPPATFQTEYTQTIGALAQTKANLFVGNIPDVTLVPYLVPGIAVIEQVAAEAGLSEAEAEGILGLLPTDYINLSTYADIPAIVGCLEAGAPCPLSNPGTLGPLDPGTCPANLQAIAPGVIFCILHASDIATIQGTVAAYNAIIDGVAAGTGANVVDINSVFTQDYDGGVTVNGYTGTFGFLGGLFGLDGIHPSNTGYGVLANAFIGAINGSESSNIQPVDLAPIAAADPLWPPNLPGAGAVAPRHGAIVGRSGGRLPTYAQAKVISDMVNKTLFAHALAKMAATNGSK